MAELPKQRHASLSREAKKGHLNFMGLTARRPAEATGRWTIPLPLKENTHRANFSVHATFFQNEGKVLAVKTAAEADTARLFAQPQQNYN